MIRTTADPFTGTALRVALVEGVDETVPSAEQSFDNVLSTRTLCSTGDVALALAEVRRVPVPGGRFVILEHGRARSSTASHRSRACAAGSTA